MWMYRFARSHTSIQLSKQLVFHWIILQELRCTHHLLSLKTFFIFYLQQKCWKLFPLASYVKIELWIITNMYTYHKTLCYYMQRWHTCICKMLVVYKTGGTIEIDGGTLNRIMLPFAVSLNVCFFLFCPTN